MESEFEIPAWNSDWYRGSTVCCFCDLVDLFYCAKHTLNEKPEATCWTVKPLFKIDYMFAPSRTLDNIKVVSHDTLSNFFGSDHFPCRCEILLQNARSSPRSVSDHIGTQF